MLKTQVCQRTQSHLVPSFAPTAVPTTTTPPGIPIYPSPVPGSSGPVTLLLELPLSAVGCSLPQVLPPNQLCSCFPLGFGD